MARPTPNFVILDGSFPDVGRLVAAMLKARQAVESRSWSHPQEPTTEVKFTEWTSAGEMRHPSFLGLREDKKPEDVVLEKESRSPK